MRPPTSSAALCGRSSVLSLSCFLFVLLLSVPFTPSFTLAADGPPFSPCQVTSIRLSTLDGSQAQDVWSDGQYKSLAPFKLSSSSSSPSDKTQLRAQVTFVTASEASWRSIVTAQVNNDGFVQYFRAPGGDRADPPMFEQELQGFRVSDDDQPNHLVINADCVSMFETDVSIVVGSDQAGEGGGEGAGDGSDGNAGGGGAGSSDGGNSGSPTTPPPGQGASDAGSSTSTAPEPIDADGNGVPDNPYADDNDSDGNGVPDNPAGAAGPDSTTSSGGGTGGDVSVDNNNGSGASNSDGGGGAGAADVGAGSSSGSSSEFGGQDDGSVNQLGDGNSAASTSTTVSLTPTALLIVAAAAAAL